MAGTPNEKIFSQKRPKVTKLKRSLSVSQYEYTECPRGFGNIKRLAENDSVSERCLGCYMIVECYSENK